jgi:hypothetical protein
MGLLRNNATSLRLGRILWINDLSDGIWPWDSGLGMYEVFIGRAPLLVSKDLSGYVRFSGSAGGHMGGQWHRTSRRIHIFLRKWDWEPWISHSFFCTWENHISNSECSVVSDRISYTLLSGRWYDIVLKAQQGLKLTMWQLLRGTWTCLS